jgi:hypothetical protein
MIKWSLYAIVRKETKSVVACGMLLHGHHRKIIVACIHNRTISLQPAYEIDSSSQSLMQNHFDAAAT